MRDFNVDAVFRLLVSVESIDFFLRLIKDYRTAEDTNESNLVSRGLQILNFVSLALSCEW